MLIKITCNRMRKLIDIKGKVPLYSNQITFSYNQWCHRLHLRSTRYKQFPQKKKKTSGRKKEKKMGEGQKGGKEEKKKKGMQGVCAEETKKGRMRCGKKYEKEGEGEGKKEEKKEQKMEKATQEIRCPLHTHSLARS